MDLIRDFVFLTTLLHCVMANSLHPNNGLPKKLDTYNIVSPVPQIKTLQAPSYDQIPQVKSVTPYYLVNPSWQNRHSLDEGLSQDKVKSNRSPSYKPEPPGTALKGIGLKYPLTMPHVKLNFVGTSGMLPVKQNQDIASEKYEPPNKTTDSDVSKLGVNDRLVGRVELHKSIQDPSLKLNQYIEQVLKAAYINHPPVYPDVSYDQNKQQLNNFHLTPSYTPEQPGIFLNPTNYPSTNPGIDYKKVQEALKNIQYTPSYKYEQSNLGSGLSLPQSTFPTNPGVNYGKIEDQAVYYTSKSKPDSTGIEVLKPTEIDYPPTNPGLTYGEVNWPEKADQNTRISTPSYETYVPDKHSFISKQKEIRGSNLPVANLPTGSLKPENVDYNKQKTFGVAKANAAAIELPPVPTTMSLLQRTQLALLNTVAGLPGGNPQALNAVRIT